MEKLKIFVSYPPGGGGQFMCLLLISLQNSVTLVDKLSGHPQLGIINAGRDHSFQFGDQYTKHTSNNIDVNVGANWLRENFKFNHIDRNYYTIHGFIENFEVITTAYPEAKIIHINPEDDDIDQTYYNFVIKSLPFHQDWHILKSRVLRIQERYNRLRWVDADNMINYKDDVKLMCYIMKFGVIRQWSRPKDNLTRCYWIDFKDMFNKNLINQLDNIIEFLNIEVTDERRLATIQLINEYADAQKVVPWHLTLEDYS